MDDDAYCAYGCPQGKRCPVADPNLGCVVGTLLPNNPGRPRCCEVDDDQYFIDRVRAILAYGNCPDIVQQNAGISGVRQALGALLDNMNLGGPPAHNVIHQTLKIFMDNLCRAWSMTWCSSCTKWRRILDSR